MPLGLLFCFEAEGIYCQPHCQLSKPTVSTWQLQTQQSEALSYHRTTSVPQVSARSENKKEKVTPSSQMDHQGLGECGGCILQGLLWLSAACVNIAVARFRHLFCRDAEPMHVFPQLYLLNTDSRLKALLSRSLFLWSRFALLIIRKTVEADRQEAAYLAICLVIVFPWSVIFFWFFCF